MPSKPPLRIGDPVGMGEFAAMFNIHRRTIHAWHRRDALPDAEYEAVNGCRAWERWTVLDWALSTGRVDRLTPKWRKVADAMLAEMRNDTAAA